ncbi:isocitrate lyase [Actinoplanes lobatus]|uniref:Isocitrate lyase n=1 Tax=Actinoplanes lobatus TaxID=113568 RepID=A0A7W7HQ04_9ACTN|nr:isocitrate lyase [Actinoplanes lobatus]MBB4754542.1 isocitrate lyase [Actinoplanes lobatus]GGN66177.1 isocitrate lyase [Actinoplanes lobatus]GIE45923.1 isocitrate lyase [Actinoplanes lobatus]
MTEFENRGGTAEDLTREWANNPRWAGIKRDYTAQDVVKLRGTLQERHTLAERGAAKLWELLHTEDYINALGSLTGGQATQMVRAGLKAIYLSGWQVAADANLSGHTYPDQSLYPANSVPAVVRRINNALLRADQIDTSNGKYERDWFAPIVADAEAGFGGPLNAFELMKGMIAAGAAGVHWEDQLASEKKCGHLGGKVLIPTQQHVRTLNAARLAADVAGVPTLVIARTDALAADLLTTDVDPRDQPFVTGERTSEGFFRVTPGDDAAIARGIAYADYADMLWVETGKPDLEFARKFAEAVHAKHPGKLLSYNCSPSFNWKKHLDDDTIARFQKELGAMGYKFQFVTLAGFHALNHSMFELAKGYSTTGMSAYVKLQEAEFAAEADGYTATKHQAEVGTGYFDAVSTALNPDSSTTALSGSTEAEQF